MVDKKAMNVAKEAFAERMDETNDSLFEGLEFAIEAYEAARPEPNPWRPIGECPSDVPFIGPISGGTLYVSVMTDQGEMFRTIDPPPKQQS